MLTISINPNEGSSIAITDVFRYFVSTIEFLIKWLIDWERLRARSL